MRRKERAIEAFDAVLAIVEACDCFRIGLTDTDGAYIVPLNFGYDSRDGQLTLYFHCAKEGRKMALMTAQPAVTFEMDTGHGLTGGGEDPACAYSYHYQCVMGRGTVEEMVTPEDKAYGLTRLMAHYTGRQDWTFQPGMLDRTAVMKLTVTAFSCKACQAQKETVE